MKCAIVELKYVPGKTHIVPITWIKKFNSKFKPTQSFLCYISVNIADVPNFDVDYFKTDFNGTTGTFKVFIIKITNSFDDAIIYQREKRLKSVPQKFREPSNTETEIKAEQNRKRLSALKTQKCNKRKAMVRNVAYLSDTLFKVEHEEEPMVELPQKKIKPSQTITNCNVTSTVSSSMAMTIPCAMDTYSTASNDRHAIFTEHHAKTVPKDNKITDLEPTTNQTVSAVSRCIRIPTFSSTDLNEIHGGCNTVAKNGLQSFPSNKIIAEKWIDAIKAFELLDILNTNKLARSYKKVCKKHFCEGDFKPNEDGKSLLVANSVPSLFLPDDSISSTTVVASLKPLTPLKRCHKQFPKHSDADIGASKKSKNEVTLENNYNIGLVVNDLDMCTQTGVDLNCNDMELHEKRTTSARQRNTTVHKTTIRQLSQKALFRKLRDAQNKIKELRKACKLNDEKVIDYLSKKNMNSEQLEFIKMQITNCDRPKHGRRYNTEQKNICLALRKHGGKSYRFLELFLIVPSQSTVGLHSAKIMFKTGVNPNLMEAIKNAVNDWPEEDKYCVINWDEVSLDANLEYCHSQLDENSKPEFATHALTFMLRGINKTYKQSIGYFYTKDLNTFELVELVKLMIGATLDTGLKPILSVCDQVAINASTINELVYPGQPGRPQTGQLLSYTVKGQKLLHCYDIPHIIKTVRNNFEVKDLVHFITKSWRMDETNDFEGKNDSLQVASWDHVLELYLLDLESAQRRLPKLTAEHLKPTKLKMKVCVATQVFSNTCGNVMLQCVENNELPNFEGTAQLLLFMNDLFDSMNGSEDRKEGSLKHAVTPNSVHFSFWQYALYMLSKMYFIEKTTCDVNNRSSVLKKTESTIRGYIEFSKLCFQLNIPKVSLRNTGQDGLENWFGTVNNCNNAAKMTPRQYRTGYMTMTINNITGKNSLHSNCQPDKSEPILNNFHQFIFNCQKQSNNSNEEVELIFNCKKQSINFNNELSKSTDIYVNEIVFDQDEQTGEWRAMDVDDMIVYDLQSEEESSVVGEEALGCITLDDMIIFDSPTAGENVNFLENQAIKQNAILILQKLMKCSSCEGCKNQLKSISTTGVTATDSTSETIFFRICKNILCGLSDIIPYICHEKSLKIKLIKHNEPIDTGLIGCGDHNLEITQKMQNLCADQMIGVFCKNINSFLSNETKILPENYNHIQKLAHDLRKKKKAIGKFTDIFTNRKKD